MSGLFSFLYVFFFITLLVSIFKPSLITKFIDKNKRTLVLLNGGLFLLFFTLTGITYQTTNIQGIQETKPSAIPTQTITIDSTYTPIPPIPTEMITPKPSNTYVPTGKPTVIPTQYILPTSKPTQIIIPTIQVQQPILNNEGENFSCNCAKTCAQMSSCAEAQYQLNVCGCGARDGDNDGIACDRQCQ